MVARVDCTYGLACAGSRAKEKKGGEFEGVSNSNSNSNAHLGVWFFFVFLQKIVFAGQGIRISQRAKKKIA